MLIMMKSLKVHTCSALLPSFLRDKKLTSPLLFEFLFWEQFLFFFLNDSQKDRRKCLYNAKPKELPSKRS